MTKTAILENSASSRSKRLPLAVIILAAGLIAALLGWYFNASAQQKFNILDEDISIAFGPKSYDAALADIDRQMKLANERVDREPDQWAYQESLAINSLIRAQLTGSFDDYKRASDAIETAMQVSPDGGGPAMTDAIINLSLHRYGDANEDLDRIARFAVPPSDDEQAEILASQGDIAFYSGEYAKALALYQKAREIDEGPRTLFRLATWYKYNDQFDQAIALYEQGAEDTDARTPQMLSVYLLQIGALELQRGNWELAHRYFARADRVFPGYWLAEAHVAQMLAVEERFAEAENAYLAIIGKTNNPDVMMALSSFYEHRGDDAKARSWLSRAGAILYERAALLPEAYYDHALDFAITNDEKESALEYARKNYQARPYGDASIALARAYLLNEKPKMALDMLQKVNQSGWKSVEQYLSLVDTYEQLGETEKSEKALNSALKMNPKADDPGAGLLAFGSH